jgi:cathepsin L
LSQNPNLGDSRSLSNRPKPKTSRARAAVSLSTAGRCRSRTKKTLANKNKAKTKKQTSPEQAFDLWRLKHGKPEYPTPSERSARLSAFKANAAFVAQHNRRAAAEQAEQQRRRQQQQNGGGGARGPHEQEEPARLELNAYADLTWDEFRRTRLGYAAAPNNNNNNNNNNNSNNDNKSPSLSAPPPSARLPGFMHEDRSPPPSVDWRAQGAVSPVGNQGACGSCYAWSATGAIEGANAIATGQKPPAALSVQEVLDCDTAGEDSGCGGGLMDNVFDWVANNGGIDTSEEYSYYSSWGLPLSWCNRRKMADRRVVSIDGHQAVPPFDEEALLKAASAQPVAVAVCASPSMQFYGGGVMGAKDCCEELNHGVLLVGYDEASWIVKNSWGEGWGEGGFFRLQRLGAAKAAAAATTTTATTTTTTATGGNGGGGDQATFTSPAPVKGLCGITTQSSYPVKRTADNPRVPSACDALAWAECPYAQTCGCNWRLSLFGGFFPLCLRHDCCPHPSGVDSCGDGAHCCPGDRPVCDPGRGVCVRDEAGKRAARRAAGEGGADGDDGAVPWLTKMPANYSWGWAEQQEQEQERAAVAAAAASFAKAARRLVAPETTPVDGAAAAVVAAS